MSSNPPDTRTHAAALRLALKALTATLLLAALLAGAAVFDIRRYAETRWDPPSSEEYLLTVTSGSHLRSVAAQLAEMGLIRSPLRFRIYARATGIHRQIKAGEYNFVGANTPREILDRLVEGRVKLHRITVPEGFALRQIADLVAEAGFSDTETFITAATDAEIARGLGIDAETLEGYLFPDTYYFPRETPVKDILAAMVKRFEAVMTVERLARAESLGLSVHEVVTLASIIEKETGVDSERPLISSVFHNRLRKGMRLQTDPTVIYGIDDFDGNITRRHLRTPTAYNTYVIKGLPPGPIASPGEAAIEAALFPADTDFIFFVSRNDRTHHFSSSLEEHQEAVRRYQLGGRRRTGKAPQ
ncbi:MAG: endolytic transglycosylase MltG [Desulfobacterales bacterium]